MDKFVRQKQERDMEKIRAEIISNQIMNICHKEIKEKSVNNMKKCFENLREIHLFCESYSDFNQTLDETNDGESN